MSAFLDRFLPRSERRTALWLALGGAGIVTLAGYFGQQIMVRLPIDAIENPMPLSAAYAIQALAQFALVTLAVAALIRLARAPQALAIFIALGSLVSAALSILGLPSVLVSDAQWSSNVLADNPVFQLSAQLMLALAVSLGAVAGAWIASTVTLARIKDAGFSGDEDENAGLRRKPAPMGWHFLGWHGRPASGDALIAVALVAITVIPSLAGTVLGLVLSVLGDLGDAAELVLGVIVAILVAATWFPSAAVVLRRTGVVSAWLSSASWLIVTLPGVVQVTLQSDPQTAALAVGATVLPATVPLIAALLGTGYALKREPATLDARDPKDADAARVGSHRRRH